MIPIGRSDSQKRVRWSGNLETLGAGTLNCAPLFFCRFCWVWGNPDAGRRRLHAILASDFQTYAPTMDPLRFHKMNRDSYIDSVVKQKAYVVKGAALRVVATTAQDDRVAAEVEANIMRKNGISYLDRHHLLFEFDAAGRVTLLRDYLDSAAEVKDAELANQQVVLSFLTHPSGAALADSALWIVERGGGKSRRLDKQVALATLQKPRAAPSYSIEVAPDGAIAQGDRVAVEAVIHGTGTDGNPVRRPCHFLFVVRGGKIDSVREYSPAG